MSLLRFSSWKDILAWSIMLVACLHAWLLSTITDPRSLQAAAIIALQPLCAVGTVILFIAAAQSTRGRWRYAWTLHAIAIACTVLGLTIQMVARVRGTAIITPLTTACYLATYVLSLTGDATLLPFRAWLLGSTRRAVFDALAVGLAAFVLFDNLLSVVFPIAAALDTKMYLALDIGLLFAIGIVALRLGKNGGSLLIFVLLSGLCLLGADACYTYILAARDDAWIFLAGPLYTLQRVLFAMGAYRSAVHPPVATEASAPERTAELVAWTLGPPLALFAAFVVVDLSFSMRVALGITGAIHVAHSIQDIRRVFRAIRQRTAMASLEALKDLLPKSPEQ
jgi:hypothetical protein